MELVFPCVTRQQFGISESRRHGSPFWSLKGQHPIFDQTLVRGIYYTSAAFRQQCRLTYHIPTHHLIVVDCLQTLESRDAIFAGQTLAIRLTIIGLAKVPINGGRGSTRFPMPIKYLSFGAGNVRA